jgi:hypothetical protein
MSDSQGEAPSVRQLTKGNLTCIQHAPNPRIIQCLEVILERAKAGDLRGVVMLLNYGTGINSAAVGETTFTDVIAAFEDWKFQELFSRNIETVK